MLFFFLKGGMWKGCCGYVGASWMQEKLWKAITSDAAEKRKQDDLEKAEMREPDPQIGGCHPN